MKIAGVKNLFNKVTKAMSIVEVIVAIGISTVTLTTAASFTARLTIRAQQNYLNETAIQIQNIVSEQLRLIEADLQENRTIRLSNPNSPEPFAFIPTSGISNYSWTTKSGITSNLCTSAADNLTITLPDVTVKTSPSTLTSIVIQKYDGSDETVGDTKYQFAPFAKNQLFGAFAASSTTPYLALKKTIEPSGIPGIGDSLVFTIIVKYYPLNQVDPTYSTDLQVKMVKQLVCP